jgi:hypothetical protein
VAFSLALSVCVIGCADRGGLGSQVSDEATAAQDDAKCREKGEPGTQFYDECRKNQEALRAQQSAIQYQKNRDFDRTLGRGTSDYE